MCRARASPFLSWFDIISANEGLFSHLIGRSQLVKLFCFSWVDWLKPV